MLCPFIYSVQKKKIRGEKYEMNKMTDDYTQTPHDHEALSASPFPISYPPPPWKEGGREEGGTGDATI